MKPTKSKRPRRTAEQWAELVDEQLESGLTIKQFCEQNQLCQSNFYAQRSKLSSESCRSEIAPQFIEIAPPTRQEPDTVWAMELEFPNGTILRVAK